MNATRRDLEIQFNRVVANGWLPWFQREAKRANTTTAHLLGIGSRETNLKNIRGDFRGGKYHGFGVMQVDIGTDPEYARTWTPEKVEPSIVRGVDIYLSKVRDTKNTIGRRVNIRSKSFVGRGPLDADDIRRIATAAYNCGRWAYYHFSNSQNVDSTTTGDDYSRDVYDRAVQFADILEERGYETMAVHRELELQGKYARRDDCKQYGFEPAAERLKLTPGDEQESQDELAAADYERESGLDLELSDAEITQLTDGIGTTSTAGDPAGSQGRPSSKPHNESPSPVELPAAGEADPNDLGDVGSASPGPVGDPATAPPRSFLNVEDWKNWVVSKLKWIWGFGVPANLAQVFGFVIASVKDPSNWQVYAIVGGVLFVVIAAIGLILTAILLGILWWNRKEIGHYITEQWRAKTDPNRYNFGLMFEKK